MEKDILLTSVILFAAKLAVFGANIGEALALGMLCGTYGYILHLSASKEQPVNDQVRSELEQLRNTVNGLKLAKLNYKL